MNLKQRGVTVGDLLIILIIVILSIVIVNKVKDGDKQSHLYLFSNNFSNTLIS